MADQDDKHWTGDDIELEIADATELELAYAAIKYRNIYDKLEYLTRGQAVVARKPLEEPSMARFRKAMQSVAQYYMKNNPELRDEGDRLSVRILKNHRVGIFRVSADTPAFWKP